MNDDEMPGYPGDIARRLHYGQVDKLGEPYWRHPARVAGLVQKAGGTMEQVSAAWLHDAIEDTDASYGDLESLGVPLAVIELIEALTHRPHEPRSDYYERIKAVPDAVLVKVCDIHDNLDPGRLYQLDAKTRNRLVRKYGLGLWELASLTP